MKLPCLFAILFGVAAMLLTGHAAQGPGSHAHLMERFPGGIRLDASFVAPDGCQAMLQVERAAPRGAAPSAEIIPVTIVIGPDPRGCSGNPVVRRVFNIGGGSLHNLVQIFFVSAQGQLLDTEKVAVQTGW